jgi:hypothetical protein
LDPLYRPSDLDIEKSVAPTKSVDGDTAELGGGHYAVCAFDSESRTEKWSCFDPNGVMWACNKPSLEACKRFFAEQHVIGQALAAGKPAPRSEPQRHPYPGGVKPRWM